MTRAKKPANPHAWTNADYDAAGFARIHLRLPKPALARLEKVAKRLGLSRVTVVMMGIEKIDRETEKDP